MKWIIEDGFWNRLHIVFQFQFFYFLHRSTNTNLWSTFLFAGFLYFFCSSVYFTFASISVHLQRFFFVGYLFAAVVSLSLVEVNSEVKESFDTNSYIFRRS